MSDRRGRGRSRYDDDDYDGDYYEARPRHRSLGRQALDKLSDAIGLDSTPKSHNHHSTSSRTHYPPRSSGDRAVERYYPPSTSSHTPHNPHHRRYHSTSPPRSSARSSRRASSRSRSRWERGIEAAAEAAAVEAFRLRHEPGPWRGPKGERLATAAISAGVIGAATEQRKQDHSGGKLGTLGSAVSGLLVNRLVNGPRSEVRR